MADTTKVTTSLKLLAGFADEDDRTITLINPRDDVALSEVTAIGNFIAANNLLLGDKYGAAFTRFKSAKKVKRHLPLRARCH